MSPICQLRASHFSAQRELSAVSRARRLPLRSSRRVPAGRFRPSFHSRPTRPASTRGSTQTLARRNILGSKTQALRTRSANQCSTPGALRRLRRFASVHDAAFGVGRLRRNTASHRKAAEAARGGNYRNDAVCPFIGILCALLLHREEQAQPQAKTHKGGSGLILSSFQDESNCGKLSGEIHSRSYVHGKATSS